MSGGPPDRLNEAHKRMAEMDAAGASDREVAEKLGYSVNRVWIIRQSPLYQALLDSVSKEVRAKSTERLADVPFDLAGRLRAEEERTFNRLLELRDNDDNLGVALGAVNAHLDRALPKRTAVDVDSTIHLRLTVEQMSAMRLVAAEDDGLALDTTAEPALPAGLKPLDAAISEAAEREAAAAVADEEAA